MMLRSSSTPILGSPRSSSTACSLLPESPNPHHFHHSSSARGFRRSRSAGSLNSLLSTEQPHEPLKRCSSSRRGKPVLESIPSFAMRNSNGLELEEEGVEEQRQEPERYEDFAGGAFTVGVEGLDGDDGEVHAPGGLAESFLAAGGPLPPLFLARGLGIDRVGSGLFTAGSFGGGEGGKFSVFTGSGGEKSGAEAQYKKMVEEDPSNALILRNYAEFLYQTVGDLKRAEEYYSRAILADPGDAEILSQYAKLVWELHGDEERATSYFQQAVQAAPSDSHVLADYAGFLWETEDGEDGATHNLFAQPVYAEAFASAV